MRGEYYFVSKLSCGELTGEKLLALGDVATVSNNSIIKSTDNNSKKALYQHYLEIVPTMTSVSLITIA